MDWAVLIRKVFFGIVLLSVWSFNKYTALPNEPYQEYIPAGNDNVSKSCLVRGITLSQYQWNHYTGFFCYNYTNSARFTTKNDYNTSFPFYWPKYKANITLPISKINSSHIALFDYRDTDSLALLRESFKSDEVFVNYVKCCQEAENCCQNVMTNENIRADDESCPVIWDAWSCFPRTPVDTTTYLPCSSQAYQSPEKVCTLQSSKQCYRDPITNQSEWNQQTDYSTCAIAPVLLRRHNFHVIFLIVCISCSFPAIIIFVAIPNFRVTTRVILHRNLLIAIVTRNIMNILYKKLVIIDALLSSTYSKGVMESNSVACRVLSFLVSSSTNSTYACMLVDGYYLHKVIVRAFAKEPPIAVLYLVVAVLTFLPSIIWASILISLQATDCWAVDKNGAQWSVDSFRIAILSINTVLLLDIIRVMISKMKQGSTTRQTKAAFRATLFLIPLFGLHIFITAKKIVINDTCVAEDVYDYFRYTMEAMQGIFVAVLFCYANREVQNELRNIFRKITIQINQRFGLNIRRKTVSRRRTTTATYVQPGASGEF
ncbi:calcitonin gene-related peptide type 1 receptor-like [Sitophilus oryzae]|uniref:Calcitonin gene-related peptide type 1 receptor-like n=1 Tax=Sitophilus oryzae TaxID=7048 RepID=A0A6J2XV41_SITOR|nr:calcitonin gene-related peptide type 1 receptor-like [Sitophilus oryzae]